MTLTVQQWRKRKLLLKIGEVVDKLSDDYSAEVKAIGNRIPVGGNGWMDIFFKMEGMRGVQTALRSGKSIDESIQFGCDVSSIAVKIWNGKREYQVHRWEKTAHDYIEYTTRKVAKDLKL